MPCRGQGTSRDDKEQRRIDSVAPLCHARRFVLPGSGAARPSLCSLRRTSKQAVQPPAKAEPSRKKYTKPEATKPGDSAKSPETAKDDAKKDAGKTTEPPKVAEPPLPPIPPEVQAKIDAARKAVAEAIVAAQDAGLIETSIDPPPILDLLINSRVTDARTLKGAKPFGVSPEVFGAWFTGFGKTDGINYVEDLRIMNPSARAQAVVRAALPDHGAVHPGNPQDQAGPCSQEGRGEARGDQAGGATEAG